MPILRRYYGYCLDHPAGSMKDSVLIWDEAKQRIMTGRELYRRRSAGPWEDGIGATDVLDPAR